MKPPCDVHRRPPSSWPLGPGLGALALAAVLGACAPLPEVRAERGLYRDLSQIVVTRERSEWVVDRLEVEAISGTAMRSVCKVTPGVRERVLAWLDARIAAGGGPAREKWAREGRDLDRVEDLLTLERTRALLAYSHARAADDCPFYLNPDPDFRGIHTSTDRFVMLVESRGAAALVTRGGELSVGGGGAGRLMPAWGFGDHVVVALGGEIGGFGLFGQDDEGDTSLDATFTAAVPLVVRLQDGSRLYDLEAALTTFVGPDRELWPVGFRFAAGAGLATLRVGPFMPVALLYVGYEYHPERGLAEPMHLLGVGTRVGLDFDP